MKKAVIISGNLVQDQEFIYPYYRLLEEKFMIDVCINENKFVSEFEWGSKQLRDARKMLREMRHKMRETNPTNPTMPIGHLLCIY